MSEALQLLLIAIDHRQFTAGGIEATYCTCVLAAIHSISDSTQRLLTVLPSPDLFPLAFPKDFPHKAHFGQEAKTESSFA